VHQSNQRLSSSSLPAQQSTGSCRPGCFGTWGARPVLLSSSAVASPPAEAAEALGQTLSSMISSGSGLLPSFNAR